ncbi:TerB family tellurite resistance protein [Pleurocapsa sp. PCC 7319]|uniref:tellurite resistance TerB family protein n=1 Tax=Pleurocapsa sp. PCC 7319 TaxID=118161 RepID=UPI000346143F|nr:TerB family tellurite resistance protein [Pleurocapsa sp. PCC 7319]
MSQSTNNNNQDLFKILVAVAWIDGEVQPEERKFLEKIAAQKNLESTVEIQDLLNSHQATSTAEVYELLKEYLGSNPSSDDYHDLLSAVSSLIYSDNDIATEEASLLTEMQNLDPTNSENASVFDKLISKIQQLYQAGLSSV